MINVFISRPTWVHDVFKDGLKRFLSYLSSCGMQPRTLGVSDYGSRCPLDEVIKLIDQCEGAVILGYPQIEVKSGSIKSWAIDRILYLPTEWNHIEAGLAYARGIPLLLIHHIGVCRGIFDRGAVNSFVYEKDLADSAWSLAPEIAGALKAWRLQIEKGERRAFG